MVVFDKDLDKSKNEKGRVVFDKKPESTLFGLPKKFEKAIFPTASGLPDETVGQELKKAGLAGLDVLGLPARGLASLFTDQKVDDPNTILLRKPVNVIKSFVPGKGLPSKIVKGGLEIGANILSDPFAITGLGKQVIKGGTRGIKYLSKPFLSQKKKVAQGLKKNVADGELSKPLKSFDDLVETQAPPKTIKEKIFSRINEQDRSILSEDLKALDTPFSDYAIIAKKAIENPRNLTPMDIAGQKAKKAFDAISNKIKIIGKDKGDMLELNSELVANTDDLLPKWDKMLNERLGVARFENGKAIMASGRELRDAGSLPLINKINSIVERIGDGATMQQLDDAKSAIRSIVDRESAGRLKQIPTIGEGIGKSIRKDIDEILIDNLGDEYRQINKQYARLKDLQSNMNRRLGNIVDEADQTRLASGLLKSSIQSNAERGTKSMFKRVLDETGYDLIKEAKFAEIAMKAVDDPRILNLLSEVQGARLSKMDIAQKAISKLENTIRKDKVDEATDFFIKQQGRKRKPLIAKTKLIKLLPPTLRGLERSLTRPGEERR